MTGNIRFTPEGGKPIDMGPGHVHMVNRDVAPGDKLHARTQALARRVGHHRMAIVSRVLIPREITEAMENSTGLAAHFYAVACHRDTLYLFPEGGRDYLAISDAIRRGEPWVKE